MADDFKPPEVAPSAPPPPSDGEEQQELDPNKLAAEQVVDENGLTADEKQWAMFAHISVLIQFVIPFPFLGPLIVYAMKKDEDWKFFRFHAVQSLFLQLIIFIIYMISFIPLVILMAFGIGLLLIPCIAIFFIGLLIYNIMVGMKANEGQYVKYPIVGDWAYKKVIEQDWKPF